MCVCLKNRGSGRSFQGKSPRLYATCFHLRFSLLSVSMSPFFLWLTCFSSCLLNIPGCEDTMRMTWPQNGQALKYIWRLAHGLWQQISHLEHRKGHGIWFMVMWQVQLGLYKLKYLKASVLYFPSTCYPLLSL